MSCASTISRDFPFCPIFPEWNSRSKRRVLNDPYDTVPFSCWPEFTEREIRLTEPPKVDGPIVAAEPGLRSKTVDPIVCAGKNTHEWCVGSLVSLNGMPS